MSRGRVLDPQPLLSARDEIGICAARGTALGTRHPLPSRQGLASLVCV